MNTTDLLLQMTLAATQIAQNTAPPVSDRTEDAGERRPDAQFRRAKRVGFRLRPMGVRSARVRSPYPRRRGWRSCSGAC